MLLSRDLQINEAFDSDGILLERVGGTAHDGVSEFERVMSHV